MQNIKLVKLHYEVNTPAYVSWTEFLFLNKNTLQISIRKHNWRSLPFIRERQMPTNLLTETLKPRQKEKKVYQKRKLTDQNGKWNGTARPDYWCCVTDSFIHIPSLSISETLPLTTSIDCHACQSTTCYSSRLCSHHSVFQQRDYSQGFCRCSVRMVHSETRGKI